MSIPTLTEQEIKELRNKVYGKQTTDINWNNCRENWESDLEWLIEAGAGRTPKAPRVLPDVPKKNIPAVR